LDEFEDEEEADLSFLLDDDEYDAEDFDEDEEAEDEDEAIAQGAFSTEDYPPSATTRVGTFDLERRLLLANELVHDGKTDDALKIYDTILQKLEEEDEDDPQLELKALQAMTQLLLKAGIFNPLS
jgi:hypothetical protein